MFFPYLEAGWMFSHVFQIRKCFLHIRIRGSVILNCGPDTGGQLITNPDPDSSWTFLWPLEKLYCQIGTVRN
jgi:hypothetical protein